MDITFLGTASAQPSPTRNHSSLAFRADGGDVWLFDCGEGTQHQLIDLMADYTGLAVPAPCNPMAAHSAPRLAKITRIFLTHLHGDHCFGLPGLLCTAGSAVSTSADDAAKAPTPIHIYGPRGTKAYVRNMLLHTMSRIGTGFVLHELLLPSDALSMDGADHRHIDEVPGADVVAEVHGDKLFWPLELGAWSVTAVAIPHTVPTVGYVMQEPEAPGRLDTSAVVPLLMAHKAALGLKNPLALLGKLKAGDSVELPDGHVITPESCVGPPRPGRTILILGDTSDALDSALPALLHGRVVDVVVHEATNACLAADVAAGATPEAVEAQTRSHGHSTPDMAGAFAKAVDATRLVLNHFSSRYKGDDSAESLAVMEGVRALAVAAFGSDNVVCARDFMQVTIAPQVAT